MATLGPIRGIRSDCSGLGMHPAWAAQLEPGGEAWRLVSHGRLPRCNRLALPLIAAQNPMPETPRPARAARRTLGPDLLSFTILDPLFGDCTAIFILMQFSTNAFRNRLRGDACDNTLSLRGKNPPIPPAWLHFVVNAQVADIFKRIPEAWNSTGNGKRFAKSGGRKICSATVYHARINHDAALRESNGL